MTPLAALLAILSALAQVEPIAAAVVGWIGRVAPTAASSPLMRAVHAALDVFAAADPTIEAELRKWMIGADSSHPLRPEIDRLFSSADAELSAAK